MIGGNLYKSINQNLCLKYLPKSANRFESPYEIAATKEGKFSKFVTLKKHKERDINKIGNYRHLKYVDICHYLSEAVTSQTFRVHHNDNTY